jgi:hypothetical protein
MDKNKHSSPLQKEMPPPAAKQVGNNLLNATSIAWK